MKISELISILQRVQEHFSDTDVEIAVSSTDAPAPSGYQVFNHLLNLDRVSFEVGGLVTLRAVKKPNPEAQQP